MPVDGAVRGRGPLGELRALKRSGLAGAGARVRELLAELHTAADPLDLEAAGALLAREEQRAQLASESGMRTQRVALLGSSTLDALPGLLTASLVHQGVVPEIRSTGFNQWRLEVLSGAPSLRDLHPGVVACLLDDAAVFEGIADPLDPAEVEACCAAFPEQLGAWVDACHRELSGLVVLCTVPLGPLRRDRVRDYAGKARLEAAWNRMNAAVLDLAAGRRATVVLSASGIAARAGRVFATDRMRHVAGHAYAPEFLHAYAAELTRVVRADLGMARKCLVLDLDNTLWGGVVGDDGVSGLRLGGSYPGSAHAELQGLARDLMRQGVMLAVCSKNDDEVAREAIATHPEMVLDPDSFVAVRADWNPKPGNVRELAAQLNIGTDAMVFMDDSPVERGLMRQLLPEVATVELPAQPAGYAALLAARGDFNLLGLTEEDRSRTTMYRAQVRRAELEHDAGSLEGYLLGLQSRLTVEPLGPLNSGRIVQLFGKTNQFNLTGRRYTEAGMAPRLADGTGAFFAGRLSDRFGDNGLVAAVALALEADGAWTVENFVLSCRVFSRGVEDAVVGLILRAAAARGAPEVRASFTPTAKNRAFAGLYPSLGFTGAAAAGAGADGAGAGTTWFRHDLKQIPELPRWVRVSREEEAFHAF